MTHIRVKELTGYRAAPTEATPDDLALISGPLFAGHNVTADDVHVREMWLAHNMHDTTGERFPKAYLDRFAETIPGKSVLPGHDTGAMPLGRFFRGRVTARQESAFPVLVREGSGNGRSRLQFRNEAARVTWLKTGFYFPNDPEGEAMRNRIDLGVYKWVSIGFRYSDLLCDVCKASYFGNCPHIIGWRTEDSTLVTGTYGGDPNEAEALEGSIVFLGAQQTARIDKALRDGTLEPVKMAQTLHGQDDVQLKYLEAMARTFGSKQTVWNVPDLKVRAREKLEAVKNAWAEANSDSGDFPLTDAETLQALIQNDTWQIADTEETCGSCAACTESRCSEYGHSTHEDFTCADWRSEALPSVGGEPPAIAGDEKTAPVGAERGNSMTEEEKAALTAAEKRATDAEAALASEKSRADTTETAAEEAQKALETAKPLAEIGEKALQELQKAILDDDLRLTNSETNAELSEVLNLLVGARNYDRLKEIADQKRQAVLAKFPAGKSGDSTIRQDEEEKQTDLTPEEIRRLAVA